LASLPTGVFEAAIVVGVFPAAFYYFPIDSYKTQMGNLLSQRGNNKLAVTGVISIRRTWRAVHVGDIGARRNAR